MLCVYPHDMKLETFIPVSFIKICSMVIICRSCHPMYLEQELKRMLMP